MGFLQTKGRFMKQFSAPTIKMIVWNNDKVCCPSVSQPDGFGGRKGRISGTSLWQKKHLLLKKSSYWSSAAVASTMWASVLSLPEIRLELPLSVAHSEDPYENACEDTNTLKIEDSEVQKD